MTVALAAWRRDDHANRSRRHHSRYRYARLAGGSAPTLIDQVSSQLVRLLSLRSCVFQYGVAGLGRPALERRLLAVAFADQVGAALASSHPVGQR